MIILHIVVYLSYIWISYQISLIGYILAIYNKCHIRIFRIIFFVIISMCLSVHYQIQFIHICFFGYGWLRECILYRIFNGIWWKCCSCNSINGIHAVLCFSYKIIKHFKRHIPVNSVMGISRVCAVIFNLYNFTGFFIICYQNFCLIEESLHLSLSLCSLYSFGFTFTTFVFKPKSYTSASKLRAVIIYKFDI